MGEHQKAKGIDTTGDVMHERPTVAMLIQEKERPETNPTMGSIATLSPDAYTTYQKHKDTTIAGVDHDEIQDAEPAIQEQVLKEASGMRLALIILALFLSMFLVSLDIVSPHCFYKHRNQN